MNTLKNLAALILIFIATACHAQTTETEFSKGWLINLKLLNGVVTTFTSAAPDMYAGGLALNPQVTVSPGVLRVGINASAIYADKKFSGLFGPMATLKLKTFGTKNFGSFANMHLIAEANWGTNRQQMAGGGLGFEILSLAHIGVTAQRDYKLNNWWLQSFIAIRLNKIKQVEDRYAR